MSAEHHANINGPLPSRQVGASAEAAWNTNLLNTTNLQKHWKTRDETTTSAIGDFAAAVFDCCTPTPKMTAEYTRRFRRSV